jgi:hypoxanthine phosphoribosyltransferase
VSSASSPFISESESVAITDRFQAMHRDIARIIIPQKRLQDRVTALAKEIASDYGRCDEGLTLVTVLSGSVIFLADLIRQLPMKMRIDLITVSSYEGKSTRSAEPKLHSDRPLTVRGRDVLIVDDILDTGKTLRLVQAWIRREEPRSVRTVVLLRFANGLRRRPTSPSITSVSISRTCLWSGTASITTACTAICRMLRY